MSAARAFVFAAEEDFGIVVVEVQGRGTPVIAYGKGGARETVVADGPCPTGLFFDAPEAGSIVAAVEEFKTREDEFVPENCHAHARRFNTERFDRIQGLRREPHRRAARRARRASGWPAADTQCG